MDTLPLVSPEQVGLSAARLARVSAWMKGWVDSGKLPGLLVAVMRRGELAFAETYGKADVVALAGAIAAEVVHHDLGAVLGQHQAVLAANATGASGDDRHPALTQSCHCSLPAFACLDWLGLR